MPTETQQYVYGLLRQMPSGGLPAAQQLFWTGLGYDRADEPLSIDGWPDHARDVLDSAPVLIAQHKTRFGSFDIIYTRLVPAQRDGVFPLSLTAERLVVEQLLKDHPYALFVFGGLDEQHWHLVNVRHGTEAAQRAVLRRIAIGPRERLRVASERVALLDLATMRPGGAPSQVPGSCAATVHRVELSPLSIQQRHDEAFDVAAIATKFFQGYRRVFHDLGQELELQTGDAGWAHDYALQFLSRLMAVYFVQQTRWLGDDPQFVDSLWRAYRSVTPTGRQAGASCENTFVGEWLEVLYFGDVSTHLPADHGSGGAEPHGLGPPPPRAKREILSTAPALGGGLFRRNDLDQTHRPTITDARFQRIFEFLEGYDFSISEDGILDQEVVVDPAMIGQVCENLVNLSEGSHERGEMGVFYTPRVEIDLMCRLALADWLANHLGREHKPLLYEAVFAFGPQEKRIADVALAERCLWPLMRDLLKSVTVVDPACGSGSFLVGMLHVLDDLVARANRQLGVAETSFERKRHIVEDSLYGVDVMDWAVETARLRLWLQLVADAPATRTGLDAVPLLPDLSLKVRCGDSLVQESGRSTFRRDPAPLACGAHERVMQSGVFKPFAWNTTFKEVFEGARHGFDIVIGNPPYVRQELLHDPGQSQVPLSWAQAAMDKKEYKAKLARAVYAAWPHTFGYDGVQDKAKWNLDARSDLYIYFYLKGLSLLNDEGTLCFVTSNSWLDVRYGRDLQEFLLTRGSVKLVIDNKTQRSFASADVNTAIVLLGPAQDAGTARPASLQNLARFVRLTIPFEQALRSETWEQVDGITGRCTTPGWRVYALTQAELLDSGTDPQKGRFVGDKWGGKYLRAPDIYWSILERCGDRLVRLGSVAHVRRGITTGANAFFFLDEQGLADWAIEEEFLVRAIKSPRECARVWLGSDAGPWLHLFACHKERRELQGTGALDYIEYGEAQDLDRRPTLRSRACWWSVGCRTGARIHCNYLVGEVMRFYASGSPFLASDNFQEVHSEIEPEAVAAACNSTICQLSVNALGRSNFGGGLLKMQTYEVGDLLIPDPLLLDSGIKQVIWDAGLLNLDDPDRRVLDDIIFDMLGLTSGERDAVSESVIGMVRARQMRAQSLGRCG